MIAVVSLGKLCVFCDKDEWPVVSDYSRYALAVGTFKEIGVVTINKGMLGVKYKSYQICLRCFQIMLDLEDYFCTTFPNFIFDHKAHKLLNELYASKSLYDEYLVFKKRGIPIPREFFDDVKEKVKEYG